MKSFFTLTTICVAALGCSRGGEGEAEEARGAQGAADAAFVDSGRRSLSLDDLPRPAPISLDGGMAARLARLSLECAERQYPNKPSNVLAGEEEVVSPRELHPAFFGCFDWHSAVHGHWTMVRLLRRFPGMEIAGGIREVLDRHLTEEKIAGELEYFEAEHHRLFERPYGWGWLLRLQAELDDWDDDEDARRWAEALRPLSERLSRLTAEYAAALSVPVRAGTHHSTAYAFAHAHDYAVAAGDEKLSEAIAAAARRFFLEDVDCPLDYEPSGEDFVSPCLAEADLMRRVLEPQELAGWLDRFLPPPHQEGFANLRKPPEVRDPKDPRIGHLIGLCFQRAAALRGIASDLPQRDERRRWYSRLADIHWRGGTSLLDESGYGGAHWLASFAVFAATEAGPYPAEKEAAN